MTETQLKAKVLIMIKQKYPEVWVYKSADKFTAGIPDLIGCKEGIFFAVELKVKKNHPSHIQKWTLEQIELSGGWATWCNSVEGVDEFIGSIE